MRQRGLFARVEVAFWKQPPFLVETFQSLQAPRIFVIPLFLSKGYFTEQAIPEALGFRKSNQLSFSRHFLRGNSACYYGYPVGTHPKITDLLLLRAQEIVKSNPNFPHSGLKDTALFLAGHGTPRDRNSREALEAHADRIRRLNLYESVQTIYLEEEPMIGDCYQLSQAPQFVIAPFFLSDGLHVQEDIPVLLGAPPEAVNTRLAAGLNPWLNPTCINGRLVWYAPGLGSDPLLSDIILERVKEITPVEPSRP